MSTLLLRFAAPMQAWGADSKFEERRTQREPTKSGVIGFLAAALGYHRDEDDKIRGLAKLSFGVRLDQPGVLLRDYHIAKPEGKNAYTSNRYYLADAIFLIGLESDDEELLDRLEDAIKSPAFPLFLGRRSCPPSGRIVIGKRDLALRDALDPRNEPWLASEWYKEKQDKSLKLTVVCDSDHPTGLYRRDTPISFSPEHRKYAFRHIKDEVEGVTISNPASRKSRNTAHSAMEALDQTEKSALDTENDDVSISD